MPNAIIAIIASVLTMLICIASLPRSPSRDDRMPAAGEMLRIAIRLLTVFALLHLVLHRLQADGYIIWISLLVAMFFLAPFIVIKWDLLALCPECGALLIPFYALQQWVCGWPDRDKLIPRTTLPARPTLREEKAAIVGQTGIVLTPLRPNGTIRVGNNTCEARSEHDYIEKDSRVEIVGTSDFSLIVRRCEAQPSAIEQTGNQASA